MRTKLSICQSIDFVSIDFYKIHVLIYMALKNSKVTEYRWTTVEDEILVECLLQLVEEGGWRADNETFKPGYLV